MAQKVNIGRFKAQTAKRSAYENEIANSCIDQRIDRLTQEQAGIANTYWIGVNARGVITDMIEPGDPFVQAQMLHTWNVSDGKVVLTKGYTFGADFTVRENVVVLIP